MSKTWRDDLQSASFRGVGFWVDSDSTVVGRRTQLHEYPQRDRPLVEDMGRKTRAITFEAFVIGDDCFVQRDNLLHALDQPGSGELIHPWFGRMTVTATEGCQVKQARADGGIARFSLSFVEAGEKGYPVGVANTARLLEMENQSFLDSALARYKSAMSLINKARISMTALQNGVAGVQLAIQREFSQLSGFVSSAASLADTLANFPENLSTMLGAQFSSMTSEFDRFKTSQRQAMTKVETALGLANPATASGGAATVATVTATRELVRDVVLADAIRLASAMPVVAAPAALPGVPGLEQQVATPVTRPEVPVASDVTQLRDALNDVLWQAALVADYEHFERIEAVRKRMREHLTAVARSGVNLVDMTPKESVPAVVLAFRLFADATRGDEIVARNGISHPGFLPAATLQVAQE
ncbi:DNA circularization N-terminal domain-containing protein [Pseudomonas caspiana]|uniref:DNA circularization protein n=1 Tax=Pseudomonas caspiana TaxID=1451454 RepID=UPI0032EBC58D